MRACAFAVLFIASCRCGNSTPDAGTGRIVEVARFRTLITQGKTESIPFDLESTDLSALIHDDAGELLVYPDFTGAGAATFRNIPDGSYILTLSGYNVVTDENAIDLGVASLGRASAELTDGGTVLRLDLSGLQPWQPYSDVLQLTSGSAGYVAVNAQSYAGDQPDAGSTDATFPLDWWSACSSDRGDEAPLVDADAGDRLTVTQLQSSPVGDAGLLDLRTLVRSAELSPFSMAHRSTTAVTGSLAPPPVTEHLTLDFRQSEFDAHRSEVHASAVANASTVTVSALPFTADEGAYTASPDLAVLRPLDTAADVALTFDTGNPFPATWPKLVTVRWALFTNVQYPDGGSRGITTALVVQDLLSAFQAAPIRPRVTPPRNVRVDGLPGNARAQISRIAVVSWDPPAVGNANAYGVTLFHLARIGSGPTISVSEDSIFVTTAQSIQLPFGELVPGEEYVFGVTAFDSPAAHVTSAPFKARLPFGAATALTALFRVDPTTSMHP